MHGDELLAIGNMDQAHLPIQSDNRWSDRLDYRGRSKHRNAVLMTMQPPQDFEVWTSDAATMKAAITSLGGSWDGVTLPFDSPSGKFPNGDQFALHVYGTKELPTGATTTDAFGNQVPVKAAQPGVFGIARYIAAQVGNTPPAPTGVTIIPLSQAVGAPAWE